jgi:hypothetical protein
LRRPGDEPGLADGDFVAARERRSHSRVDRQQLNAWELNMHGIIYLVGLVVVVLFLLSLLGLR